MKDVFVIDAVRTPIGKYGGTLSVVRPDDLLAHVIRALLARNPEIDPSEVEDVIAGDANQAGEDNRNVARMAALLAGLPVSVAGSTVNRLCASGLQAIMDAARAIACGDGDIYIAAGVESMSRAPFVVPKSSQAFDRKTEIHDSTIGWRFVNKRLAEQYHPYSMGQTAENVAKHWGISREMQDAFALRSQQRYFSALDQGKWSDEVVAVEIMQDRLITWFSADEHPRQTSMEKLARLEPAFDNEGTVTAGNSSGINDGAAGLLLASQQALDRYHLEPLVRVGAMAVAGVDPAIMGIGPVPATQKVLQRSGRNLEQIELIELNEAFASQALACIQELKLDEAKVNINGGAIALGHPLGCSGTRISTTLIHEMNRSRLSLGLATMCVGVGQGAAIIYERV